LNLFDRRKIKQVGLIYYIFSNGKSSPEYFDHLIISGWGEIFKARLFKKENTQ